MPIEDSIPRTIWWDTTEDGRPAVFMIDQSRLPLVGDILVCNVYSGVCEAISSMALRGAPALGVAAALALALWTENETAGYETASDYLHGLEDVATEIVATRPTAVNLAWGAGRIVRLAKDNPDLPLDELKQIVVTEALAMQEEDEERNRRIGANGAELLSEGSRVLTHCNAGSLATVFFGTALGVVFTAHEQGKIEHVWVDETRPVLQGSRLTAWELGMAGIPYALITDNMAGWVMKKGVVDAVIVGGDRIAANGDVANKIGTYSLSVLAKEHGIPFYVAAPTSSIDLTVKSGDEIPIEERVDNEVTGIGWRAVIQEPDAVESEAFGKLTAAGPRVIDFGRGQMMSVARRYDGLFEFSGRAAIAPPDATVFNPSFDVTPGDNITAIITENGVARAPYTKALKKMAKGSGAIHEQ